MRRVKLISLVLVICFLLGSVPSVYSVDGTYSQTFDQEGALDLITVYDFDLRLGDLDADGAAGLKDSTNLKKIIAGNEFKTCRFTTDVNRDGGVNLRDSVKLKK